MYREVTAFCDRSVKRVYGFTLGQPRKLVCIRVLTQAFSSVEAAVYTMWFRRSMCVFYPGDKLCNDKRKNCPQSVLRITLCLKCLALVFILIH